MIKKQITVSAAIALLTLSTPAQADNKQVVTVGQQQLTETVTRLTFDGDPVVLHLVITFTVVDALKALETEPKDAPLAYFDLNGRQLKKAPKKGGYIMKKGTKVVKVLKIEN